MNRDIEALRKQASDYGRLSRETECGATAMEYRAAAQRATAQADYLQRKSTRRF